METILMTGDVWRNSQLSIAKYYGGIKLNGYEYVIVNKDGKTLRECSREAQRLGKQKAIEECEPADLIRKDFIPAYKRLGRNRFIELLKSDTPLSKIKKNERIIIELEKL